MPPIIQAKATILPSGPSTCLSSQPPVTIVEAIHHRASPTPRGYSGGNDRGFRRRSNHHSRWPETIAMASTRPNRASNCQESIERIAVRNPVSVFCRTAIRMPEWNTGCVRSSVRSRSSVIAIGPSDTSASPLITAPMRSTNVFLGTNSVVTSSRRASSCQTSIIAPIGLVSRYSTAVEIGVMATRNCLPACGFSSTKGSA